jgi:hypothetical protein
VPAPRNKSAPHTGDTPSHRSATSQPPAAARQTVRDACGMISHDALQHSCVCEHFAVPLKRPVISDD